MAELPGANLFAVMAQAPMDLMGLATKQATEVVDTFGMGMQRLSAELATPPEISGLVSGLPTLPGMTPAAPSAPAVPATTMAQSRTVSRRPSKNVLIV